jgi:hypothetical protein
MISGGVSGWEPDEVEPLFWVDGLDEEEEERKGWVVVEEGWDCWKRGRAEGGGGGWEGWSVIVGKAVEDSSRRSALDKRKLEMMAVAGQKPERKRT